MSRSRSCHVLTAVGLAAATSPALAAGGEHGSTWLGVPTWVWLWLNLFIFWGLLWYFLGPLVRKYFSERGAAIRESVAHAEEQRREAQAMRDALEGKLAEIAQEIDELLERSDREGERERREILEQAEVERERLLAQTRDEIARGVVAARQELTQFTVELAAKLAEERIASELDPSGRRRIFEQSLSRLERAER